ncbi:MAG TPA: hypothetical protein VM120_04540 [Bryobacteraceae bacterium]|nr:hypothetical protein [Bryobacteraceae bacterium]
MTHEGILNFLSAAKRDRTDRKKGSPRVSENLIIREIEKCGISFVPTAGNLEAVRKLDGSEKLLAVIDRAKKPAVSEPAEAAEPPKVEPPKPKLGQLMVVCAPVECDVYLNDVQKGITKEGVLSLPGLPVGTVKVAALRKDYDPDRNAHTAFIRENQIEKVEFTLKESRAALDALGQTLFTRMLEALGGEAGLAEANRIKAVSRLISSRDGKQNQWPLLALIKLPDQAKFIVTRVGQRNEVTRSDAGFQWDKEPKEKGAELEDALRELFDRQFGRTMERLMAGGLKKTAPRLVLPEGESPVFRIEGGIDTYVVTLDAANYPREIRIESKGLTSGLRLVYGDYAKVGKTAYPKATQVTAPGNPPQGIELRIDNLELGPAAFKDAEIAPKKGSKALGRSR